MEESEKDIQNTIISYLNIAGHYCWRNNSGVMKAEYKGKSRIWRAGLKGSADIIGVSKDGKFIAIEVKRRGKKPNPCQEAFLKEIKNRGGHSGVAYCLEDAELIINGKLTGYVQ